VAIDDRSKRATAIHVSSPWRVRYADPSGTVERQGAAYHYSGITASGAVTITDRRSIMTSALIDLAAGSVVRLRTQRTDGSDDLQTIADGSLLRIITQDR
jgi:hypothetical protein